MRYRFFRFIINGVVQIIKTVISRMHKIGRNCICDTTVIFLYVHKISTSKKVGNIEK